MDVEKRRFMPSLLYFKTVVFLPEFGLYGIATYWAFFVPTNCAKDIVLTAKFAVCGGWLFLFFLMVGTFIVFDPLGSQTKTDTVRHTSNRSLQEGMDDPYQSQLTSKKLWEMRCDLHLNFVVDFVVLLN